MLPISASGIVPSKSKVSVLCSKYGRALVRRSWKGYGSGNDGSRGSSYRELYRGSHDPESAVPSVTGTDSFSYGVC